jgi:hypothetical protein
VQEQAPSGEQERNGRNPQRDDWKAALAGLAGLDIDWDAYRRQREFEVGSAGEDARWFCSILASWSICFEHRTTAYPMWYGSRLAWQSGLLMSKHLTAIIQAEPPGFVASCPELDIASQGDTIE